MRFAPEPAHKPSQMRFVRTSFLRCFVSLCETLFLTLRQAFEVGDEVDTIGARSHLDGEKFRDRTREGGVVADAVDA